MADEGQFYKFVEGFAAIPTTATTDRAQLEAVEAVATTLLSPVGVRTLRAFLAAHVHSPRVEMWRQLSAAEAARLGVADPSSSWLSACDRAVPIQNDDAAAVEAAIGKLLAEVAADASCQVAAKPEERALSTRAPLSVDHIHPSSAAPASGPRPPLVALHAPIGGGAFRAAHASLVAAAARGAATYVYRPLVAAGAGAAPQSLQGYGVQLAIKNMEYKAMDDAKVAELGEIGDDTDADGADGGAAEAEAEEEAEEHGFLWKSLGARRPELGESLGALRESLAASAAGADSSKLKVWAMQDLGVQAAARVLRSKEPLAAMVHLCQNFPFVAGGLAKEKVDRALEDEIDERQQTTWGPGYSGLFLNGRMLPSGENDLFGLMATLQRELRAVDALGGLGLPAAVVRRLVSLPPPSGSLRIEMRHPALLLLNDVSKDRRYAQWPASVKELLRPNMFGQISFCRKNILTMVFVVDPAVDDDLSVLSYMAQLLQNGAPIRFGMVLAPGASPGNSADDEAVAVGKLYTKLLIFLKRKMGNSAALTFVLYVMEVRESGGFFSSSIDPLDYHHLESAFEQAVASSKKAKTIEWRPIYEGLRSGDLTDYDDEMARGGQFLAEKGISQTPVLLMNGALTKLGTEAHLEQAVMTALNAEVASVTKLVRSGVLTDDTEDVYGTIANASSTFPRFNDKLLVPASDIDVAPLRPHPALAKHMQWVTAPAAADAAARQSSTASRTSSRST